MSILLSVTFIIILLVLGFGWNAWNLVGITLIFTFGLAALLATTNIEETKANWKERRCDIDVMMMGGIYKPSDSPLTSGEFGSENFSFCMKSMIQSIIITLLTPVFAILGQQVDLTENINQTFDRYRVLLASFYASFQKIMDPFWKRFRLTSEQVGINFQKFYMAMSRVFGISIATLYMGMGLTIGIENFVAFVIRVVMIMLYIILSVLFILIIGILPFFPIIVAVCQTIGNSPFGYMTEEVCGELCLDPDTLLQLQSGEKRKISQCVLGDILEDGSRIEGILRVKSDQEPLYMLQGIRVSGAHMVWSKGGWIMTKDHPEAKPISYRSSELLCLRTDTHRIPIRGNSGKILYFLDWEEIPEGTDSLWETIVHSLLNEKTVSRYTPKEYPMMRESCEVLYKTGEKRRISEVKLGDEIYSSQGFTKVIGLYEGQAKFTTDADVTDGTWLKYPGETRWNHPSFETKTQDLQKGFHLITESGCFWISTNRFSGFVRDFTEVGKENLVLTYPYTSYLLKKSLSREESCVSTSLSQALLSY